MKLILLSFRFLISLLVGYFVLEKLFYTSQINNSLVILKKDKIKILIKQFILYSQNKFKILKKFKINCNKLGINILGIEVIALLVGTVLAMLLYGVFYLLFKIKSVAFILAIPFIFFCFALIEYLANRKQDKLEEIMNDFFIQFRGEIKVNNDVVSAFKKIKNTCLPPFDEYINRMMIEINAGEIPEEALKRFADKIDIEKFSLYINNLKYCSVYGGNVEKLTSETQKMIEDLLKQKKKRKKETNSVCMSLYMLIGLDLLIYFNFIANNHNYINMMRNTLVGNTIVNINFISIWLIVGLAYYVRKLDL